MTHARAYMSIAWLILMVTISGGVLSAPLSTDAQPVEKVYRIGFLYPGSEASGATSGNVEAFQKGLQEYGWVEGQNLKVEYRYAEGEYQRFPSMATELVRLKVDVIVAATTPGTRAAMQATTNIPIVFTLVADPVASGFVDSLARPGGNSTGLSHMSPELAGKLLEMLTEVKPGLSHVVFLAGPQNLGITQTFGQMQSAAQSVGVTLHYLEVGSLNELKQAFTTIANERPGALFVPLSRFTAKYRTEIGAFARTQQLPIMTNMKSLVRKYGGLISYAANTQDVFRRVAPYVDKMLRGIKPSDLPVEQPTTFQLILNLKTANALGLTIPPSIRVLADEVIQ